MGIKLSNKEIEALQKADTDLFEKKVTDAKCPRCGGSFEYVDCGSGYIIQCKTNGCIKMTVRGI